MKQIYGLPIVPRWITGIVCFTGLGLLSAGHLWKDRRRYLLSIAGWIIYGIFWLINIPATNLFNATFFVIGNIFFWYFAYHEYLSYRWNESCTGLEFVRGTSALSSVLYFLIDYNPWLSGHLIWIVSANTAWALNILGITPPHDNPRFASFPEYSADGIEYGDEVKVHIDGSSINIILACTAIEAIVIFIAGLIMTKSTWARRLRGLAITLPTIWIGNIIRNMLIIYLVDHKGMDFETVHGTYSKIGTFLVLILLAVALMKYLPELYESMIAIFDLPVRKKLYGARQLLKQGTISLPASCFSYITRKSANEKRISGKEEKTKKAKDKSNTGAKEEKDIEKEKEYDKVEIDIKKVEFPPSMESSVSQAALIEFGECRNAPEHIREMMAGKSCFFYLSYIGLYIGRIWDGKDIERIAEKRKVLEKETGKKIEYIWFCGFAFSGSAVEKASEHKVILTLIPELHKEIRKRTGIDV